MAEPANKKDVRAQAAEFLQAELAKMQARVQMLTEDNRALIEEYTSASDEEAPEVVKKNIRARMPRSLEILDELLETANDGTRANLIKWIIDRGLNPDSLGGIDAEAAKLNKLLETLTG